MKVLILGHRGMLGNAVYKYLTAQEDIKVYKINNLRWPSDDFKIAVRNKEYDFIVNCIGSIPQRKNNFSINVELPRWLDRNVGCNIIHPGTDCEVDIDEYGLSKKEAFDYIVDHGNNTKIIKTSIIGHEIKSKSSLLEWFLGSENKVRGFNNHFWNGNTTLEWSKFCYKLIKNWEGYKKVTILESEKVSKYDLLCNISEVYNKKIKILSYSHEKRVDNKCLQGDIKLKHIKEQLKDLKDFYDK